MELRASTERNSIGAIYAFCKKHALLPRLSRDKKHWFLRPNPAPISNVIPIRDRENDDAGNHRKTRPGVETAGRS